MEYCYSSSLHNTKDYNMEALHELGVREQRLVYLVTYSRADLEKAPTRESFAEAVTEAWMQTTGVRVQQWVVAREMQANMTDSTRCNIFHYHMALKIEKRTRWLSVRNWLDKKYGNFDRSVGINIEQVNTAIIMFIRF